MDEELAQIGGRWVQQHCALWWFRGGNFSQGNPWFPYNRYAFQKLDKLRNAANAHGLMVGTAGWLWGLL